MNRATKMLVLIGALAALIATALYRAQLRKTLSHAPNFAELAYVGAKACESCHADRHQSWSNTFHRTMTQPATAQSVQGAFDGQVLQHFGGLVRPVQGDGAYWFEYLDETGAAIGRVNVVRTVGSHRYQQYLTQHTGTPASETYFRLQYLWHNKERRWVHANAAFLGTDQQDFDAQTASWNATCVFCHNTGPKPRLQNLSQLRLAAAQGAAVDFKTDARYDTEVAELGISCESCHAPGAEHVQRMQFAPARLMTKLWRFRDHSIINPKNLSADRSNAVCGACHAQRTPKAPGDVEKLYAEGPSFRPGDVLSDHVTILQADTPSPDPRDPHLFQNRFWSDGSVRLTAYELQAQNASLCGQKSALTCINCHTMHGGDPNGMLPIGAGASFQAPTDAAVTDMANQPCLRCHQDVRNKVAAHTQHAEGAAQRCVGCHMPRQVYGVMEVHRTHQTQVPDVARDLAAGKPNACLNCHAEQSPAWVLNALQTRWPKRPWRALSSRLDGAPIELADGVAGLLAGDPVRQAVAAFELGRVEQAMPANLAVRLPWLLAAMRDDRPGIRRFAWRSASAINAQLKLGLAALDGFDYIGESNVRESIMAQLDMQFAALDKSRWPKPEAATGLMPNYQIKPAVLAQLVVLGSRADKQIDIGE